MSVEDEPQGRPDDVSLSLAAATSVKDAAEMVVEHLQACGVPFPSLYLEQAGRLRCHAQRGYWQTLDGIPCDVGVIARAVRSGRTVEVTDASKDGEFLFAAPDLQRQISVPIRHASEVVGALNVEARAAFATGTRQFVEQVAAVFEQRLAQLGGPPAESAAQRVARLATAMAALESEPDVRQAALDAATSIADMSSAALIEGDGPHQGRVVAAMGPLGVALCQVDPFHLAELDGVVRAGSSLYATGTATSDLQMHHHLRSVGVAALAVVPLTASGEHLGSLLVASGSPRTFDSLVMPSLEILSAQTAASLRTIRTVSQLQRRARQDPLTKLGHHATFHEELRSRLAKRAPDRQVAVLVIDVDDFKAINDHRGHLQGDRILRELSTTLSSVLRSDDRLYRIGGDEFATILEVAAAEEAQHIARRMIEAARAGPTTISIGLAIAADETADEVVARADAAMYRAKAAGRDGLSLSTINAKHERA